MTKADKFLCQLPTLRLGGSEGLPPVSCDPCCRKDWAQWALCRRHGSKAHDNSGTGGWLVMNLKVVDPVTCYVSNCTLTILPTPLQSSQSDMLLCLFVNYMIAISLPHYPVSLWQIAAHIGQLDVSTEGFRRGFNASTEIHKKYEPGKVQIPLIYLHQINYQLKQSDKSIPFNRLNRKPRYKYTIE